jgi:hypothetical protein
MTRHAVGVEATGAEQLGLLTQDGKITPQAVAAVSQQHRKIPQHLTRPMAVPAGLGATRPPAQRGRQPEPVGQLHQQRRPCMPGDPVPLQVTRTAPAAW